MDANEGISDAEQKKHSNYINVIEKLFPPESNHGCVEKPTTLGFLALCIEGSDIWNKWRDEHPEAEVDMSNTVFPESGITFKEFNFGGKLKKQTSFANSEFGNCSFLGCSFEKVDFTKSNFNGNANFSNCLFNGTTYFKSAKFNKKLKFKNNTAQSEVNFIKSTFSKRSEFTSCAFYGESIFQDCKFLETSSFNSNLHTTTSSYRRCEFKKRTEINGTFFNDSALFENACFLGEANMQYSTFSGASFESASFREKADFRYCKFGKDLSFRPGRLWDESTENNKEISFKNTEFRKEADFEATTFHENANFSCSAQNSDSKDLEIRYIFFCGSIIKGKITFSNRRFIGTTHFGRRESSTLKPALSQKGTTFMKNETYPPTRFFEAPIFHGCRFHQNIIFEGAEFLSEPSADAARAYRTLKVAMEQFKATREEQKFYWLEMKAEHPELSTGRRLLSTLYELFSDYGFSSWRPLIWLLAMSLAFGTGYGVLANACAADRDCAKIAWHRKTGSSEDRTSAVIKYTLASVSPVPGLDKMQTELREPLFGHHGWIPITALVLEILHKIVALVMAFLFALALRNLFKMKS